MKHLKKFNESFGSTFEIPSHLGMAIQELGQKPDVDTIISVWNDLMEDNQITSYSSESSLFIHEDGAQSRPEDIFEQINDYLTDENY
jgi:hypothetical protein